MPDSKDVSITDDAEFLEIEKLVKEAKDLEKADNRKAAKPLYLDAADLALKLSKTKEGIEKLTYENICRALIEHVKDLNILIDMETSPLPAPPGSIEYKKTSTTAAQMLQKQEEKPPVEQLMIIKEVGLPVYSNSYGTMTEATKGKINEILFSGALTAVNQLMQEVVQKPIQNIQFENGNIVIQFKENLIFVAYVLVASELIEKTLIKFANSFIEEIFPKHQEFVDRGGIIPQDEETMVNLIQQYFKI